MEDLEYERVVTTFCTKDPPHLQSPTQDALPQLRKWLKDALRWALIGWPAWEYSATGPVNY